MFMMITFGLNKFLLRVISVMLQKTALLPESSDSFLFSAKTWLHERNVNRLESVALHHNNKITDFLAGVF